MTTAHNMELPEILLPYQEQIEKSLKPVVNITTVPNQTLTLWQSKFGGLPYFPIDQDYPKDDEGNPLYLLAQFNFADIPALPDYPTQGILQFYIVANDDLYGLDFDDQFSQKTFRVVYFEQVTQDKNQLMTDFSFLESEPESLPFSGDYALKFELVSAPISLEDCHFSTWIGREAYSDSEEDKNAEIGGTFSEKYEEIFGGTGHKLGGYPSFTQNDPREYNDELKSLILLFQMDTDNTIDVNIMWGDTGIGNFFIHPDDLKNKNFSKVLYNWDCC